MKEKRGRVPIFIYSLGGSFEAEEEACIQGQLLLLGRGPASSQLSFYLRLSSFRLIPDKAENVQPPRS